MKTLDMFTPNKVLDMNVVRLMVATQVFVFLIVWSFVRVTFLPKPSDILAAFSFLWSEGLGGELVTSFFLNIEALILASLVSLGLAYLSVLPFFRPIVAGLGKLRFLSPIGLTFFFTIWSENGHELKVSLLVFSVSVFYITGAADIISGVPKQHFDLARTLGMSEWRSTLEVIVFGQIDQMFVVFRQNAAMSWMLLTFVESISREGGGIGTMLLDQNKHFHLDAVFAIQITILLVGLGQDYAIGLFRKMVCPYVDLALERK